MSGNFAIVSPAPAGYHYQFRMTIDIEFLEQVSPVGIDVLEDETLTLRSV